MKILIVSDTHRRDGNLTQVLDMVGQIDLLIHCGDVEGSEAFIKSIAGCPVHMVAGNNDFFLKSDAVGLPIPGVEIRIDDPDEEGVGEIAVRGPNVMLGYYNDAAATDAVLRGGWFYTGDYGRMNDKGQLMITGRKKNLIVLTNGKNVFPEEIENYIAAIPYVAEVVVYGLHNEHGLEDSLCAEIFLSAEKIKELGIEDPAAAIKEDVARAVEPLPHYKRIAKIKLRDTEFEKTTTNKIRRNKIVKD